MDDGLARAWAQLAWLFSSSQLRCGIMQETCPEIGEVQMRGRKLVLLLYARSPPEAWQPSTPVGVKTRFEKHDCCFGQECRRLLQLPLLCEPWPLKRSLLLLSLLGCRLPFEMSTNALHPIEIARETPFSWHPCLIIASAITGTSEQNERAAVAVHRLKPCKITPKSIMAVISFTLTQITRVDSTLEHVTGTTRQEV